MPDYAAPSLNTILQGIQSLRKNLPDSISSNKVLLIALLESLGEFVKQLDPAEVLLEEEALKERFLGAAVLCFRDIYHANLGEDDVWDTKDEFYTALFRVFNIHQENYLNHEISLIYLQKFYDFIFSEQDFFTDKSRLLEIFAAKQVALDKIMYQSKQIMRELLIKLSKTIALASGAIPSAETINNKISHLLDNYEKQKLAKSTSLWGGLFKSTEINADRVFGMQLVVAIIELEIASNDYSQEEQISRSLKITLGAIFYFSHAIYASYYFPTLWGPNHSESFNLFKDILDLNYYSETFQRDCIIAFCNLLTDNNYFPKLQTIGYKLFHEKNTLINIDSKVYELRKEVDKIIKKLTPSSPNYFPIISTIACFGSRVFAPIGYAGGEIAGLVFGKSNSTLSSKLQLSAALDQVGQTVLTDIGGKIGFLAASLWVERLLMRAFAQIAELGAQALGGSVAGVFAIGLVLVFMQVKYLSKQALGPDGKPNHPVSIKNINPKLLECLAKLPEGIFTDVFTQDKQLRLEKLISEDNHLALTPKFS